MESPIDNFLYDTGDSIVDYLHKTIPSLSPNMITTVGLAFGLLSIVFYIKGFWPLSILFLFLFYFSDCMDGHYARKYDKVTKFGDYYDHFRDWFIGLSMICLIIIKLYSTKERIIFISLTTIILVLCFVYVGCQEAIGELHNTRVVSPEDSSPSLQWSKRMCPNPTSTVKMMRFFSPSTFILFLAVYIWYTRHH